MATKQQATTEETATTNTTDAPRETVEVTCIVCSSVFEKKHRSTICSPECRRVRRNEQSKASIRKRKESQAAKGGETE